MSTAIPGSSPTAVEYPDSDGQPIADNTLQFEWIATLKGNLEALFADSPDVFVAGDLLWYPVEGRPEIRVAPDALVAFGRPKGYRGSYIQFREGGIAPQVVFEVLSPNNTPAEMARKLRFYEAHGVEEYYLYDPEGFALDAWLRTDAGLEAVVDLRGFVSPRLGIRFEPGDGGVDLRLFMPNGERFLTFVELFEDRGTQRREARQAQRQARRARRQADEAGRRADEAEQRAEAERLRAERLAEKLRQLGLDAE